MRRLLAAFAAATLIAAPAFANLNQGDKAPDFTAQAAQAGQVMTVHLASLLQKGPVVLYFFPAAFTGGCNAEAHAFATQIADFKKAGATVIGMSTDTVPVLQKFSQQQCAGQFPVASATNAIVTSYGVGMDHQHVDSDGVTHNITSRTSYVIARDGHIVLVHSDMNPADHISLTLAAVQKLRTGSL